MACISDKYFPVKHYLTRQVIRRWRVEELPSNSVHIRIGPPMDVYVQKSALVEIRWL
jgi:hypothetical protein